jgi:[acyl-carrier-protein] S-malonyltransferase
MFVALFPGQGVQAPGMDLGLADVVPSVFDTASEILGTDVAALCRTGTTSDSSLASTRWAQPAVLVCSVASYLDLRARGARFETVAGHSVGEYAALVACEAISFADALSLIATRAAVTAEIAARTDGAMAALMRIEIDDVHALCIQTGVALAADNAPGQCVISGEADRVTEAMSAASGAKAITRRLEVDGAFHSPLMEPAIGVLREALSSVVIRPPNLAFWSSTTATRLADPETIRSALLAQLVGPVRWRETVGHIASAGGRSFTDIGPGKVIGALVRRIVPQAELLFAADHLASVSAR